MSVKLPVSGPIAGYEEFELDIERVLKEQLPTFFERLDAASLTQKNILAIPLRAKGAYLLLHKGIPVYAGKTDARHGFRNRLDRHLFTVQHRVGLDLNDIEFKAVRVLVFSNFDVEAIVIERMRSLVPGSLRWNDSGFGSNDTGENRDMQEPANFDTWHPIDIDRPLDFVSPGRQNLLDLLKLLKNKLPYTFRYETDTTGHKPNGRPEYAGYRIGHADQRAAMINVPTGPATMRALLTEVVALLRATNWQATIFPGYVILYRQHQDFKFASDTIR